MGNSLFREFLPFFFPGFPEAFSFSCASFSASLSLSFRIFSEYAAFVRLWLWVPDSLISLVRLADSLESAVLLHAASILRKHSLFADWRFPLSFRCFLHINLYQLRVLQSTQRRSEMKRLDVKALIPNERIILTSIITWFFDKCNTIIPSYLSMRSLNSFKARA